MSRKKIPLPEPYPIGSRHILRAGATDVEYEWAGNAYGWSTPGTRWCTSASMMSAVGWRYLRPAPVSAPATPTGDPK